MYINKNTCIAKTEVAVKFTLQSSIRRSRYVVIILHVANVFMHCIVQLKLKAIIHCQCSIHLLQQQVNYILQSYRQTQLISDLATDRKISTYVCIKCVQK